MTSSAKAQGMQVLILEKLSSLFIERNMQQDFICSKYCAPQREASAKYL